MVAAVVSLIIRPQYASTTRLMPPEKQGLGGMAALLAAGAGEDKGSALVGGFVSDAIGLKSSGALYVGILRSATVQDAVIKQFDLRNVYKLQTEQDTRNALGENTSIDEDRKSGIISITVTDRSPQRAMEMARFYPRTLGQLTTLLNATSAHQERVFLEDRLSHVKQDLDDASKALSDFSSKNLTLDVKEQGKAMVTGAATLQGELIAAESQLSGMQQIYTGNNVRVRALQARVDELRRKLRELMGTSEPGDNPTNELGISVAKLPAVGVEYADLYRRAKIQEAIFETLTKQYELAKIEEAKSAPTIKVLDEAQLPERKSSPQRTYMTLFGGLLCATFASAYIIVSTRFRTLGVSHPLSTFGLEVREGIREDMSVLKNKLPARWLHFVEALRNRLHRTPPHQ
jgi:capsule polysaccharide export protein KpsE/RkpR